MRYFFTISYDGTPFYGWQVQSQSNNTIQGVIEVNLSKLLRFKANIIGCGRTDSGVHAKDYVFHLDVASAFDKHSLLFKLNRMLPPEIVIHSIDEVDEDLHARYSATSRSYTYQIHTQKDPFNTKFSYLYPYQNEMNLDKLNQAAELLLKYSDFFTFCKSNSDANTTLCEVRSAVWSYNEGQYFFKISADRYLRGMIRLIVGMCLNVERGKLTLNDVEHSLANKERLSLDWSVPACGLCLHSISYD